MFDSAKQFFSKNKQDSSNCLPKVKVDPRRFEISSEISISHLKTSFNSNICKKSLQHQEEYQYSSTSPTQKNMDLWLTEQSIIPTIEENPLLTESASEIEGMINTHMTNNFKSAFCFDMPQEIFYDLD